MNRRELLVKSGLFLAALTLSPSRASALGGVVLETGSTVPDFDLPGSSQSEPDRNRWSTGDLRGRWLAVYFYPRDFTGGCTIEARGFESLHAEFLQAGAEVIGISADSVDEHESFCESEGLSFPLLSDPDGTVSKAYGSWMAPYSLRHSFLIDPDGVLRERWVAVRPNGHAREVLDSLTTLQNKTTI
ncbi:peroxiredoxin [Synechococcus sp. HB1133]|uniref:peroxiredoxin n=1 Tax=unclassified Synechococcus TaxID=2626047 RepID=UPI000E0FCE6F|nr:peroxiredoxin [Synechococcus sp. UW69]MCB4395019.1 peroxiredoxin [Synechococcus sp. PH41509]MCB4421919.1 peroxiredoxin [Synechococcus sp. HB1133]MCB4430134.1 peroxiredoxin [Synechococcus sp. HBA1120]NHI80861.1 peroxiredoxin [Synechococcus sp. HB1133]